MANVLVLMCATVMWYVEKCLLSRIFVPCRDLFYYRVLSVVIAACRRITVRVARRVFMEYVPLANATASRATWAPTVAKLSALLTGRIHRVLGGAGRMASASTVIAIAPLAIWAPIARPLRLFRAALQAV